MITYFLCKDGKGIEGSNVEAFKETTTARILRKRFAIIKALKGERL